MFQPGFLSRAATKARVTFPWLLTLAIGLATDARAQTCTTERVSTDAAGAQVLGPSFHPRITPDGRFVVFESLADTLVAGDTNGIGDVFRKDRASGQVLRASVRSNGAQCTLPAPSYQLAPGYPSISADGRVVAFASDAADLVSGDTNGFADVFAHDFVTGQTTLVSATPAGTPGDAQSGGLVIHVLAHVIPTNLGLCVSGDGRFVAFTSAASDLVPGDTNGLPDVFVRDLVAGTTELVSVSTAGVQGNWESRYPALSDDGRFVAFASRAATLVAGDTNDYVDVFLRDRLAHTTTRVSVSSTGVQSDGDSGLFSTHSGCGIEGCGPGTELGLAISGDGRFVAFSSDAMNLVVPASTPGHVFVHDRSSARTEIVSRVPLTSGAQEGGLLPQLSRDGRYITFTSALQLRDPADTNGLNDVFRFDRLTQVLERSSVRPDGSQVLTGHFYDVPQSSVTADGSVVVFDSSAIDMLSGDTNSTYDVFARECSKPPGEAYCFAEVATCPCGNAREPFAGCANASGGGGALDATGVASVSNDSLRLSVTALRPSSLAVFVQATGVGGGVLGDGLQCTSGALIRLGSHSAFAGAAAFGAGVSGDPSIAVRGSLPAVGGLRHYQVVYRDAANFCTPSTFNASNGFSIPWTP